MTYLHGVIYDVVLCQLVHLNYLRTSEMCVKYPDFLSIAQKFTHMQSIHSLPSIAFLLQVELLVTRKL